MTDSTPDPVASTDPTAPAAPDDAQNGDDYLENEQAAILPVAGLGTGTVAAAVHPAGDRKSEDG